MSKIVRNADGTATFISTLPEFIPAVEAAALLGMTRQAFITEFITQGKVDTRNFGESVRVRTHDVLDLQEARRARQQQSFEDLRDLEDVGV